MSKRYWLKKDVNMIVTRIWFQYQADDVGNKAKRNDNACKKSRLKSYELTADDLKWMELIFHHVYKVP